MSVCTTSDVFDFCGTAQDIRTTNQSKISDLILRVVNDVEVQIGRKIEPQSFTDKYFQNGVNCEIYGNVLYFSGKYRDVYQITSVTECDVVLSEITEYGQGDGYFLDIAKGTITKTSDWCLDIFSLKMSGSYGLGGGIVLGSIKQAVIELVAAKSGLWKFNVETEGGTIQQIRTTPNKATTDLIRSYMLGCI